MARALGGQNERLRFDHIATIAKLPLSDRSLDGVLCSSVLEYLADPAACLGEFARVLRPGGMLVVSVPNRHSLIRRAQVGLHRTGRLLNRRWFAFLAYSHHEYTPAGFRALLREHGFTTDKGIPFGSPIPHWLQRREFGGSLLAFCATRE
jgi:SAM-dependent methyltransferase